MSYLTTQLIARIAQRMLVKSEHPEDASRHFNIDTLSYIKLTETDEFTPAVEKSRAEFVEHVSTALGIQIDGDTPKAKFLHARKLSKDLQSFSRYPDSWDV